MSNLSLDRRLTLLCVFWASEVILSPAAKETLFNSSSLKRLFPQVMTPLAFLAELLKLPRNGRDYQKKSHNKDTKYEHL